MNQKAIVSIGILAVFFWLFLGIFLIIPWQVASVFIAISIGIPTLLLHYERGKSNIDVNQANILQTAEKEEKIDITGSPLLPDVTEITKLKIDNDFLDRLYEEARSKAVKAYNDAKLSEFSIQAFPFRKPASVHIYFYFYSKWANRTCHFQYSQSTHALKHYTPNKQAMAEFQKGVFEDLPWKTSPHFLQALSKIYDKIKPLPSAEDTNFSLSKLATDKNWSIKFEDGLSGNDYWFKWDGLGLDETNIKRTH
jgi:hypothetical protein